MAGDQREQAVMRLRQLIQEGLDSGPAADTTEEEWSELRAIASGEVP